MNSKRLILIVLAVITVSSGVWYKQIMSDQPLQAVATPKVLQTVITGVATINVPVGHSTTTSYTTTVQYDLGFIPTVEANILTPGGIFRDAVPVNYKFYDATAGFYGIEAYVDYSVSDSALVFTIRALASRTQYEGDWQIRYYLKRDTAN